MSMTGGPSSGAHKASRMKASNGHYGNSWPKWPGRNFEEWDVRYSRPRISKGTEMAQIKSCPYLLLLDTSRWYLWHHLWSWIIGTACVPVIEGNGKK
ncbi:hypothetical protein HNY73_004185 [Argiope bruennichi]|uniref:Uncharacterized protein n=1 Tax=Argiope bruennichi TaxID=94029 RepID=A0A8T0FNG0_ARGBR|nr:hypothetical protein HNY73_004185 [Argiope bruennichi]